MSVKPLTQAALAKALGLTEGRVSQLKTLGMPLSSVEAAQAWREQQQNVAARKPLPASGADFRGCGADFARVHAAERDFSAAPADFSAAGPIFAPGARDFAPAEPFFGQTGPAVPAGPDFGRQGPDFEPAGPIFEPTKPAAAPFAPNSAPKPVFGLMDEDFQTARTRREIAEANLAEMREAELEGRLIRVEVIRAAWAKRVASTRDALLQIPSRLAPTVAAQSDVDQVARVLEEELRQALAELSRDGVPVQEVA